MLTSHSTGCGITTAAPVSSVGKHMKMTQMIIKYRAVPFIVVLALWIIASFFLDRHSPFFLIWFALSAAALLSTLIPIIYSIFTQNRQEVSVILFKLSKLPFLIIAAHIIVQITGRTWTDEGGWWILYLLLAVCIPLSLLLYASGLCVKKYKPKTRRG